MEPKTRLAEIFAEVGIVCRPTEETLNAWNMTLHRFNSLVTNKTKTPMTVTEMNDLKTWLHKNFKGKNQYLFESDMPADLRSKQLSLV